MKTILASASPRRKELLSLAGIEYEVVVSECEEILPEKILPHDAVMLLAKQKAEDVFSRNSDCMVIAADTVVALEDKILGKPKDEEDAFNMLSSLSGRQHTVYTGVCIMTKDKTDCFFVGTDVEFYSLTEKEIREYHADQLRFKPKRRRDKKLTAQELKELAALEEHGSRLDDTK